MSLWRKWQRMVDTHNSKQDYATQEECWCYSDIFAPIMIGVMTFIFSLISTDIKFALCLGGSAFFFSGLAMFLNWKIYD